MTTPIKMANTVAALLLLAGCASGPDYHQVAGNMPPAYHGQAALDARNDALPAAPLDAWWTGFHDPALTRIVERVLAQNLDLAAALARVVQARAAAQEAGARQLPAGAVAASATRQRQGYQSAFNVGASWELDLAGGLQRGLENAGALAQAAEAERLGVRVSMAAEAADAYFRVRAAQRRIALAQAQVDTDRQLLEMVRLRQAGGLAASREAFQAEALVAQTRAAIAPLEIERATQLNRLDVLMGAQPGSYAQEMADMAPATVVPAIASAGGPADLLRRRPDVVAAERRLAASSARIGIASAQYYPTLSLAALLGHAGALSAGLGWRLFDFGRIDADIARARGANAEALAQYRSAMLHATEDVENAIVTLTRLEAQGADLSQQVVAQAQARDAAQQAYLGGAVSLFEVLGEDRQLLAARDLEARVQADQARAAVGTFRALGGGW
ncbi:MAG: efflux transporter outer membrane subunit [Pseudomonadota bacterium]